MSEREQSPDESLVLTPRRDLVIAGEANTLVSRGLYELADSGLLTPSDIAISAPNRALAFFERGVARLHKMDYCNAIKDFDAAINLDPRCQLAYSNRGEARLGLKEYDEAIKDFDMAIRLSPTDTIAYTCRGRAWYEKTDFGRAIDDFDEAIRLNPTNQFAFSNRGLTLCRMGNYEDSLRDFGEAIRLNPTDAYSYGFRGYVWYKKGHFESAINDYVESVRLDPNDPRVYCAFAWLLAMCPNKRIPEFDRAIQLATKACELTNWKNGFTLDTLAAICAESGQFDNAVRYQQKAIEDPAYSSSEAIRRHLELYKKKERFR